MILAGIDIGTNTIRLLVADIGEASHQELYSGRKITRLGQGLDRTGFLSSEAQERSLDALAAFDGILRRCRAEHVDTVGTSALRRAANADAFSRELRLRTGLELRIIDGREEARLTLAGVRRALSQGKRIEVDPLRSSLLIDIGGGSTEIIVTDTGGLRSEKSLDLGAVYLFERFLRSDPPADGEIEDLRQEVRTCLDAWEQELVRETGLRAASLQTLAGTAGTVTTLAAMDQGMTDYDPARINGYRLAGDSLDGVVRLLARTGLAERRMIPGLEPGREDIILSGAIIAQELMHRCEKREMLVSDWGLREGIVFDRYERMQRG